jgi:hypothetical protein
LEVLTPSPFIGYNYGAIQLSKFYFQTWQDTMLVKPLRNWVKNLQETLRKIKKGKLCYYLTQAIAVTE